MYVFLLVGIWWLPPNGWLWCRLWGKMMCNPSIFDNLLHCVVWLNCMVIIHLAESCFDIKTGEFGDVCHKQANTKPTNLVVFTCEVCSWWKIMVSSYFCRAVAFTMCFTYPLKWICWVEDGYSRVDLLPWRLL